MELDTLLRHYFGTDALDTLSDEALEAGVEKLRLDLGVEREPGRKFALWALLHGLGAAPDPEAAFKSAADRNAAFDYIRLVGRAPTE